MNRKLIIERVEIYERPKQFTMKPVWYHKKKMDHEVPEDIKKAWEKMLQRRKDIENNGIKYEGITYYVNNDKISMIIDGKLIPEKWTKVPGKDYSESNVPYEIREQLYDEEFNQGIVSKITGHRYLFSHISNKEIAYFPNQHDRLSALYDKMIIHIENIRDNYVGKPVKLTELPLKNMERGDYLKNDYPDFSVCKNEFGEMYASECSGGTINVITKYFTLGKLHMIDLQGRKIIAMCDRCNGYTCEGDDE